jgi:hypothetical protein
VPTPGAALHEAFVGLRAVELRGERGGGLGIERRHRGDVRLVRLARGHSAPVWKVVVPCLVVSS